LSFKSNAITNKNIFTELNKSYIKKLGAKKNSFLSNIKSSASKTKFSFDVVLLPFQMLILPEKYYTQIVSSLNDFDMYNDQDTRYLPF